MQSNVTYQMVVFDPNHNAQSGSTSIYSRNMLWVENSGNFTQTPINVRNGTPYNLSGYAYILFDTNTTGEGKLDQSCNMRASPLVIQMTPSRTVHPIQLTAPQNGVWFDILGGRSLPLPHMPQLISWIKNASEYMFLVKPNAQGKVTGIDQLFGDNTMGPDGNYAANGYKALAKYDGTNSAGTKAVSTPNGVIDANDQVFSTLRLWSDKNHDGKVTSDELLTLDQGGIASISLNPDASFVESDKYGNLTTLRATVTMKDGSTRLIFDLWFAIAP